MAHIRLSMTVLALAGALAFTGCGSNESPSADTSASQQVNEEAKNKIPDFVNSFFKALRSGGSKDLSKESNSLLSSKGKAAKGASKDDVVKAIDSGLSAEEKQKIIGEMKNGADPLYNLIDRSELSDAENIVLSLKMISSSKSTYKKVGKTAEEQLETKVNLERVTIDGNQASVPPSAVTTKLKESALAAATASPTINEEREASNTIPLIWNGSEWKVNGKKYFEALK